MSTAITGSGGSFSSAAAAGAVASTLPYLYVGGCRVSWNSVSQVQISVGQCRSDDNTQDLVVAGTLTADITTTGANGRNVDTAETADKWYAVYVILNPTTSTVAAFLINEDDVGAFTFPAGYTVKRRVGWVRNDSGSDFRDFRSTGGGFARQVFYNEDRSNLLALWMGSSTTWSTVSCAEWIPPDQILGRFNGYTWAGSEQYVEWRVTGSTLAIAAGMWATQTPDLGGLGANWEHPVDSSRQIDYRVSSGSSDADLFVYGYVDDLSVI